jgi:hypothetical protein
MAKEKISLKMNNKDKKRRGRKEKECQTKDGEIEESLLPG